VRSNRPIASIHPEAASQHISVQKTNEPNPENSLNKKSLPLQLESTLSEGSPSIVARFTDLHEQQ
jgi:hypothetical protein